MKKVLSIALASTLALSMVACSSQTTTTPATSEATSETPAGTTSEAESQASTEAEEIKIAFFMYENSNTFTTYIRKGMESYGATKNVVVESFDGKSDQATQTDSITTALAKGEYDLIVVNPVDSGAGDVVNDLCREAGVPVIYADRAPKLTEGVLDDYEQAWYVGLDWSGPGYEQAEMLYADWLADTESIDKNGDGILQYVIISGNVAQQNAIYRNAAIREMMEQWNADGTMPNEELDCQDGNWTTDKGKDIMDTWNVKYGDQIEVVLCNNDTMARGAVESLKTAGAYDNGTAPAVYGINAIPDVWDMIEEGQMAGSVLTSPYQEAVAIIDMACNILAGNDALEGTDLVWGEFGKDVRIENYSIRLDNLDVAKEDYAHCMD